MVRCGRASHSASRCLETCSRSLFLEMAQNRRRNGTADPAGKPLTGVGRPCHPSARSQPIIAGATIPVGLPACTAMRPRGFRDRPSVFSCPFMSPPRCSGSIGGSGAALPCVGRMGADPMSGAVLRQGGVGPSRDQRVVELEALLVDRPGMSARRLMHVVGQVQPLAIPALPPRGWGSEGRLDQRILATCPPHQPIRERLLPLREAEPLLPCRARPPWFVAVGSGSITARASSGSALRWRSPERSSCELRPDLTSSCGISGCGCSRRGERRASLALKRADAAARASASRAIIERLLSRARHRLLDGAQFLKPGPGPSRSWMPTGRSWRCRVCVASSLQAPHASA